MKIYHGVWTRFRMYRYAGYGTAASVFWSVLGIKSVNFRSSWEKVWLFCFFFIFGRP